MTKLINANFNRLFKSKLFWGIMIFMFANCVSDPISVYLENKKAGAALYGIDSVMFSFMIGIFLIVPIFVTQFIGADYSDGTVRNKICTGKKRKDIYLANFIVCTAASLLFDASALLAELGLGSLVVRRINCSLSDLCLFLLLMLLLTAALSAICVLFSMLITSKSTSVILTIILSLVLIGYGSYCAEILEYNSSGEENALGVTVTAPEDEYFSVDLTEEKQDFYEFMMDLNPGGQAISIATMDKDSSGSIAALDAAIIILFTAGGLLIFGRKDLK